VERNGRSIVLRFPADRRELWDLAQGWLTSPVKKVRWILWTREPGYPALLSGISALSRRTMLVDDRMLCDKVIKATIGRKIVEIVVG